MQLKEAGIKGVIVGVPINKIQGGIEIQNALSMEGVVWVANPVRAEPSLARRATCRPLLVCEEFGSAMIDEKGANTHRSATALSLTCSGDVETFKRIGGKAFKLLFNRGPYHRHNESTNAIIAFVTIDDARDIVRYPTPAGMKTSAEYAVDICQSLLDRKYLLEIGVYPKVIMATVVAALFACVRRRSHKFIALILLLVILFTIALFAKLHLPLGTVFLIYVFTVVITPIFATEENHDSVAS